MPIEMYGESRFMHFWVDILTVLYIFGFGTARLGEWRLNHIHSINSAEVINASVLDSSAEIDYRCGLPWEEMLISVSSKMAYEWIRKQKTISVTAVASRSPPPRKPPELTTQPTTPVS